MIYLFQGHVDKYCTSVNKTAYPRPSLPARFPVMLFVPPCCSTCRLLFCSVGFSAAKQNRQELRRRYTKIHARKNGPQSYIYIMQVIRSLSNTCMKDVCCGLPITGIMYFGLRQIAALRRTHFRRDLINSIRTVMLPVASK